MVVVYFAVMSRPLSIDMVIYGTGDGAGAGVPGTQGMWKSLPIIG
jgi:hypothetical protein